MNDTMLKRLHIDKIDFGKARLEDLLTVGSKIFFQTHFLPLINMQGFAEEIYVTFKAEDKIDIPVLLNVVKQQNGISDEMHCSGMIISNRNRFEKELLLAKSEAEEAVSQNRELLNIRVELESHQRKLEMQLRQLSALHRQHHDIFKVIAHDLQEPLRKAVMFASIIISQNAELPTNVTEKLNRIIAFNEHMRQMVMSLQRIEELDNWEVKFETLELEPLIESALASSGVEKTNIKLNYDLTCTSLYADPKLLENMFIELFINAARFGNPQNNFLSIQISTMMVRKNIFLESTDNYGYEEFVKIGFSDNGIGFNIDASKVFKIFQTGAQFDKISPGLAYCRKIVELHHGNIAAKSIRGKGAGFTIFIPVDKINKNF